MRALEVRSKLESSWQVFLFLFLGTLYTLARIDNVCMDGE